MPNDVVIQLNDNLEQGTRKNESVENINPCSQLGKTLLAASITAIQWTSWWVGALVINTAMGALPGVIVGAACGYAYAEWSKPCIEEKNSHAVAKCAITSTKFGYGALYGAATTGLIGSIITIVGLFKNPTINGAKNSMILTGKVAGASTLAMCKE